MSSAGNSIPGGERVMTGTGSGSTDRPTAAVSDSEAEASPPSTSTEACPLRMTSIVIAEPLTSICTASVIEAEPSAMPRSIAETEPDAALDQKVRRTPLDPDIDGAIAGERRHHPVERIVRIADADR